MTPYLLIFNLMFSLFLRFEFILLFKNLVQFIILFYFTFTFEVVL